MTSQLPSSRAEQLLEGLDPDQREVALALTGPVAVIAGAGTGKTRAITHRIGYGIATGTYSPKAVLAVTFTTRAAGEMRGRLAMMGFPGLQARTFHSAALRQAKYFWPQAYDTALPELVENKMSLVAESAGRLRLGSDPSQLRDLVSEISWAKVSNVDAERYPGLARRNQREVAGLEPEAVARVFARYEELKRDRNRIDFDDILLCAASLMVDRPEIGEQIRGTYRHLIVDEYQDVSPLQQALLDLWRGDREELCVVGDPAQTIHSFAGARSSYLTQFTSRHPESTVIRLVRDYRSTPEIIATANTVMAGAGGGGSNAEPSAVSAVTLQPVRPHGAQVDYAGAVNEAAEATQTAAWLAKLRKSGVDYREMAVLFRVNAQSPPFEQALTEQGVPYLVRGGERFYERREVAQAMVALRQAARSSVQGYVPPEIASTGHDQKDPEHDALVLAVTAVLTSIGWTETAPKGSGAVRERWESLSALLAVAQDVAAERPTPHGQEPDLNGFVAELEGRAAAQHTPSAQAVTLSTLHSAKGLEWDAVAIVGAHEGLLPFSLATTPAQVAEERRLFYVGVTRARDVLRVSWSASRTGQNGSRGPTRFLDRLVASSAKPAAPMAQQRRRRGTSLTANCRVCRAPLEEAAERKLGRHAACASDYDEATLDALRDWRRDQAKQQSLPAYCIFTDATMVAIAEAQPSNEQGLLKVPGIGRVKVDKYGADVLEILGAHA